MVANSGLEYTPGGEKSKVSLLPMNVSLDGMASLDLILKWEASEHTLNATVRAQEKSASEDQLIHWGQTIGKTLATNVLFGKPLIE